MGIGIGIGAETFSAETEIALYCIFLEFVHFNSLTEQQTKKKKREKKKQGEKKKVSTCNSTKPYFTSVCDRALHPYRCLVKGVTSSVGAQWGESRFLQSTKSKFQIYYRRYQ